MKIEMIMLAAGNSRRFGSNKLLHVIDGEPMYSYTWNCLLRAADILKKGEPMSHKARYTNNTHNTHSTQDPIVPEVTCQPDIGITVVTQYEEIAATARRDGARVLYNPHPEEGISSSLKLGLKANRTADACLFSVADQPWLSAGTIVRLVKLFLSSGKGMACVSAGGKLGNPCIFSRNYYPELMELYGDIGGKHVLTAHRNDTAVLELENEKELIDIDVKEIRD